MVEIPDVTVAVPTYRREAVMVKTVQALLHQSHTNLEVVVIDQTKDHLPETTAGLLAIKDARLRYFHTAPPSVTAAKNFALRVARAPIIIFVDDDIIPNKDLVKYHLSAYDHNPSLSAVAGRVMQAGFPVKKEVLRFDEFAISHGVFTATEPGYTNAFPGGNCSMRVKDALQVGGFDTRYYANAFREENDMSLKMARAGMKIYYEPRAELLHLAVATGGSRAKAYRELYDTPMFYRNELFFTLRAAESGKRIKALRKKYYLYCLTVRHGQARRRRVLFFLGLLVAIWRLGFGRKIVTREVTS